MTITRKGSFLPLQFHLGVVISDIARSDLREQMITLIHFTRHPLQCTDHAVDLNYHRRKQMRDAVITRQFHAFGVNEDHAQIIGCVVHQETSQDRVHTNRFTRAGRTCNQQMRHVLKRGVDGVAGHIFAKRKPQRIRVPLKRIAFKQVAQSHQRHLFVRDFDTDIAVTRHRGLDTDARRGKGQCKIIGKRRDLVHAHFRAPASRLDEKRLHSELRDRRSTVDLHHLHGRAERCQRLLD